MQNFRALGARPKTPKTAPSFRIPGYEPELYYAYGAISPLQYIVVVAHIYPPCHRTESDANLLEVPHTFHCSDYFVIVGIRTCLRVSDDPMFLWIPSNSCPPNSLLVRSHLAEIIIAKCLIQGHNSVIRVRVEPRSFDQGRRKNDAFIHSATLPTTFECYRPTLSTMPYYAYYDTLSCSAYCGILCLLCHKKPTICHSMML